MFQRFSQVEICGLVLGLKQFLIMLQLPQKIQLTPKVVKRDLNNHLASLTTVTSKSLIHSVLFKVFILLHLLLAE